jgi:hypothetical protein
MRRFLAFLFAVAMPGCDLGPGVCGLWNNNPDACPAGAQTQTCPILMNVTGTVTVWDCNIPPQYCNGAPGQNDGALPSCGCVICQTSEQAALEAAQQILAMQSVSVDPSGPPLQCRGPIATLSTAYDTGPLFTVGECTQVTQATCTPCDDGQGGTLQSVGQYCNTGVGMAPVPGGVQCCAGLTCSSTDNLSGTCQGTLQPCPQPPPPNWQPLTTSILRQIAGQNNIGAGLTGVQQSQKIGLAFEAWVLTTIGVIPAPPGKNKTSFMSMERQNNTGGLPASVIPEFVGDQTYMVAGMSATFDKSVFYEVKAVTGALTPGTSNWQIVGLLDVARSVQPVPAGQHPAVFFITTGNTTVSSGVLTQATMPMWNVAVWQQQVLYDANGGSNPNLTLGPPACLTPGLCASAAPVAVPTNPGPPVSPLTSPTTPPSTLLVPGDPDAPEVD